MKTLILPICLILNLTILIIGCSQSSDYITNKEFKDSLQRMTSAYYSAEDVIAYAYLNTDLGVNLHQCNNVTFFNEDMDSISPSDLLGNALLYVYIPKYVCEKCVFHVCRILRENDMMDKTKFILQYDVDYNKIIDKADFNSVSLIKGKIGLPIEEENILFIFTLSQDLFVNSIYAPDIDLENLTNTYIYTIKKKACGDYNIRNILTTK